MKATTISSLTKFLSALAENATKLVPLLQITAVIVALVVIGLMVWKGKS